MRFKLFSYHFYFSPRRLILFGTFAFLVYFIGCLPSTLFKSPTSTIILSKDGQLMNAKIATDGQWRFPAADSIPYKFQEAIMAYEDRDFRKHVGISYKAIGRALISNIKSQKVVSGGSTITMQIARMARGGERTIKNKIIESIWALRLEFKYSKDELLAIYASNAPFGGNVVGLEAASWRYYGLSPFKLSWAEMATLAVLPNAPSLVHPNKNRAILLRKRNKVLKVLLDTDKIDEITYELALEEPLIGAPKSLPSLAPHLMASAIKKGQTGQRITTTLDYTKQQKLGAVLARHQQYLSQTEIHNAALLVIDLRTNEVVVYQGNSATENTYQKYVDLIQAQRSSGSILKPFLYAAMTQEGMINNHQLIPDVPMQFNHFSPKNYDGKYEGAVRVSDALSRSLNIPAVYLLRQYGIDKFLHKLKEIGQKKISKSAEHYGLSLILGGAETTLWDVANAYAGMAKTLNFYNQHNAYASTNWESAHLYTSPETKEPILSQTTSQFDAGAIYETFKSLLSVNRPYMEASWQQFSSSAKIAWKTGTSFGNRDAWAVGSTPNYVVAVWVGNATGEGRPGIVGTTAAGPIMFDVFSHLETNRNWFSQPFDEMTEMTICKESGYRSTGNCTFIDTVSVHQNALRGPSCHFHEQVLTDLTGKYRYYRECSQDIDVQSVSYFVLPPLQAYFYKKSHPNYTDLPPFHPSCIGSAEQTFAIVYPQHNSKMVATIDLDGSQKGIIFEASHPNSNSKLYWHVDNHYLGETHGKHVINYIPEVGKHLLTVMDEMGNQKKINFTILDK